MRDELSRHTSSLILQPLSFAEERRSPQRHREHREALCSLLPLCSLCLCGESSPSHCLCGESFSPHRSSSRHTSSLIPLSLTFAEERRSPQRHRDTETQRTQRDSLFSAFSVLSVSLW